MPSGTLTQNQAIDPITALPAFQNLNGLQGVVLEEHLLGDSFYGALDDGTAGGPQRWIKTTASGGEVSPTDGGGVMTIATNGASTGAARLESMQSFPVFAGSTLVLRLAAKMFADAAGSMILEAGFRYDADNYAMFIHTGTNWFARVYSGGAATIADEPLRVVIPGNFFINMELRINRDEAHFILNRQIAATFTDIGKAVAFQQVATAPKLWLNAANSGSTMGSQIAINNVAISRYWQSGHRGTERVLRISQASDLAIFKGIGQLVGFSVGSDNAQSWQLTNDAGTVIYYKYDIAAANQNPAFIPVPMDLDAGLKFDHLAGATADEVHVHYRT